MIVWYSGAESASCKPRSLLIDDAIGARQNTAIGRSTQDGRNRVTRSESNASIAANTTSGTTVDFETSKPNSSNSTTGKKSQPARYDTITARAGFRNAN